MKRTPPALRAYYGSESVESYEFWPALIAAVPIVTKAAGSVYGMIKGAKKDKSAKTKKPKKPKKPKKIKQPKEQVNPVYQPPIQSGLFPSIPGLDQSTILMGIGGLALMFFLKQRR